MAEPLVTARGVTFSQGSRIILKGIDLDLVPGRVTCVMGPNGSGKTTLLTIMALLRAPSSGVVRFEGRPAGPGATMVRRRFGVVLKAPNLFRTTVLENMMEGLRVRGVPPAGARFRATSWLERLKVAHLAPRRARTLSSGEAARVAFARALATDPRVLFMDEPFSAFDPAFRARFIEELGEILRGALIACLLVTHEPAEARALGHEVAILADGAIGRRGAPDEILAGA